MNQRVRDANAAWTYLATRLEGGIACVQEAHVPEDVARAEYEPHQGGHGATVVSFGPSLDPATPLGVPAGRGSVARIRTAGGRDVQIASVHTATGKIRGFAGDQIPAYVGLDWLRNELKPLLDAGEDGADVIIGGDFNSSTQWSKPSAHQAVQHEFTRRGFLNALAGVRAYGPENGPCPCGAATCAHSPTLRKTWRGVTKWWSVDYIWISTSLRDRVCSAQVDDGRSFAFSDHACAHVDLDL